MASLINDVLGIDDLPMAELHALKLLGEVYPVGDGFSPVDLPSLSITRAAAVAMIAPARFIADRRTAAWVWSGYGGAPSPPQFCIDIRLRKRQPRRSRCELREVVVSSADVVMLGGLPIMSALRTAIDISRDAMCPDALAVQTLAALLPSTGLSVEECIAELDAQVSQAYCRTGRRRLVEASAVIDAVDVVDRVDATDSIEHPVQMGRVTHLEHEPAHRKSVA